jgi:hypothetical protein
MLESFPKFNQNDTGRFFVSLRLMTPPHHPPKPRLVLRVGITGHRPNKLHGAAVNRIETQLPSLFAAIDTAAQEILATNSTCYSDEPPMVRLVSSLAEGADQMAVVACPAGWQVEAILPFPLDEYLKDFDQSAAGGKPSARDVFKQCLERASVVTQLAFHPSESGGSGYPETDAGKRDQGYANAGSYLLKQIDLLFAVWDGRPPKTGGTGALARKAYDEGIPVVWLSTVEDVAPRLITKFDDGPATNNADCTKGSLLSLLIPIFSVAAAPPGRSARKSVRTRLEMFFQERWRPRCWWPIYDWLKCIASAQRPRLPIPCRSFAERSRDWDKFLDAAPETGDRSRGAADRGNLRRKIETLLLGRFIWAGALAEHYGHKYRSAYVLVYLLSAAAILLSILGMLLASGNPSWEGALSGSELAILVIILVIVFTGRSFHWHGRWVQYRALAESLRHGRFLAFVSEFGRIHESKVTRIGSHSAWVLWYIRATMREIGLPTATLDDAYQGRLLQAALQHEIEGLDGQVAFHEKNQVVMGRIDRALHRWGLRCFFVAAACVIAEIVSIAGLIPIHIRPVTGLLSILLPALGAALTGIRAQGDFEGSRERSAQMFEALEGLADDYRNASHVSLVETSDLLIATAQAMSEDLAAWQELYGRKWLNLP